MIKKNEIYRASVTGFTSEGLGVCRVEGCAVFVPNAAPGEEYDIRIEHIGKRRPDQSRLKLQIEQKHGGFGISVGNTVHLIGTEQKYVPLLDHTGAVSQGV